MGFQNTRILDKAEHVELALELLSFAGGENQVSEDHAMKSEEARQIENWDAISIGGMERSKGFNEVGDGGASYAAAPDMMCQHKDSGGTVLYTIINGDLVKLVGAVLTQDDAAAFTAGIYSVAVSAGGILWITNQSDGLKKKTVGVAIATPASVPPDNCSRISNHKTRLIAEGSLNFPRRVYGTRAGVGNWTAADAWSLANDAWSIDLPEDTKGHLPNFPSGNEILVFTDRGGYALLNFPNTAFRPLSPGIFPNCGAPDSIALGDEGVYFLSTWPTLGVYRYDGVQVTELTYFNKTEFVNKINLSNRIHGVYRNKKYYLFYNETGSGVNYQNRCRVFDAQFNRWMNRPVNTALSDNFGIPALLRFGSNNLYAASSRKDKVYELETEDNSDEGQSTQAVWKSKVFSSRDFAIASGGEFGVDDVRLKLIKMIVTFYGSTGSVPVLWDADRGLHTGTKTIDLTASGDLLNSTFILNSSLLSTTPQDRTVAYMFPNGAVGRRFQFTISNSGTSTRPKIKKIKIIAAALEEK